MAGAPEPRGAPKRKSRVILYHSGFAGRFERFIFASPAGALITLLLFSTQRKRVRRPVVPVSGSGSGSGPLQDLHGLDLVPLWLTALRLQPAALHLRKP